MDKKNIVILGSTGSIGVQTLNVIRQHIDTYNVYGLVANSNIDLLINQCIEFKPKYVVLVDKSKYLDFREKLINYNLQQIHIFNNSQDIIHLVSNNDTDIVMSAIIGAIGLLPTYFAIKHGKKVLLANKESLIIGGRFIMDELAKSTTAQLIPVDSEHSAIFQALQSNNFNYDEVSRIILTASGGPFLGISIEELQHVTLKQALNHPNWSMGAKITIDSSTLMNKGLEVIEAYWLFGRKIDLIDVIIHKESIIHSMVEFIDGSILAQMGLPNMQTAISYAISYPHRLRLNIDKLDFKKFGHLTFQEVDFKKFPCLKLAIDTIRDNEYLPTIMNAANEVAVSSFLQQRIKYLDIYNIIIEIMNQITLPKINNIEDIIDLDTKTRATTSKIISVWD